MLMYSAHSILIQNYGQPFKMYTWHNHISLVRKLEEFEILLESYNDHMTSLVPVLKLHWRVCDQSCIVLFTCNHKQWKTVIARWLVQKCEKV